MNIQVYINHGRYLATCPKCGNHHLVEASQVTLVCPACWPGLKAQKIEIDQFGASVLVPHVQMVFFTRDQAQAAGEEYDLIMPDPQIMEILRPRPIENMNWTPGESLDFLREENASHGLEV